MIRPQTLILELAEELSAFEQAVCQVGFPTMDLDAALAQLFGAIKHQSADDAIADVASQMAHGDALYGQNYITSHEREAVYRAASRFMHSARAQIESIGGYLRRGYFSFEFKELLNDHTVILAEVGPFCYADPRARDLGRAPERSAAYGPPPGPPRAHLGRAPDRSGGDLMAYLRRPR